MDLKTKTTNKLTVLLLALVMLLSLVPAMTMTAMAATDYDAYLVEVTNHNQTFIDAGICDQTTGLKCKSFSLETAVALEKYLESKTGSKVAVIYDCTVRSNPNWSRISFVIDGSAETSYYMNATISSAISNNGARNDEEYKLYYAVSSAPDFVSPTIAVTGVTLDMNTLSLTVGDTQTLTVTVSPDDATDKSVTWASDNTSVAKVDSTGKVTAAAVGTANIIATTVDGSFNASCAVTVNKADPEYTVPAGLTATYGDTLADVELPTGWTWVEPTTSVGNAGTKTFKADFTPADTANYNTVSNVDVVVTVSKAIVSIPSSGENDTAPASVSVDGSGVSLDPLTEEQISSLVDEDGETVVIDLSQITNSNVFEIPAETGHSIVTSLGEDASVISWLREDTEETTVFYGLEMDAGFLEEGTSLQINFNIETNNDVLLTEAQLDRIDQLGSSGNVWVFDLTLFSGGNEVHDLGGKTAAFYVDLGEDWDENEIGAYYIAENGTTESIPLTFETSRNASGSHRFAVMELSHFSVYMLYRKAAGKEAVISTETMSYSSDSIYIEGVAGQEYIIVPKGTAISESDWSTPVLPKSEDDNWVFFEGLKPATEYEIYTRTAATETSSAGAAVKANVYTTLSGIGWNYDSELVGATITVEPEPETEGLTYKWYQDDITVDEEEREHHNLTEIDGVTGTSYTFRAEDVGKYITVKIFAGNSEVGDVTTMEPVALGGTVIFNTMGGSEIEPLTDVAYQSAIKAPTDPTREGFAFDGWYWEEDYETPFDFEKDVITWTETTLYAKWTPNDYNITSVTGLSGANDNQWTKGTKDGVVITVKISGEDDSFDHFTGVKLDGKDLVKDVDYIVEKGSTIVTLKPETLEKLSAGEHTVTVLFDNGEVNTTLTVLAANSQDATSPQTGDNSHMGLWIALMMLSLCGLAATLLYGRKKRVFDR